MKKGIGDVRLPDRIEIGRGGHVALALGPYEAIGVTTERQPFDLVQEVDEFIESLGVADQRVSLTESLPDPIGVETFVVVTEHDAALIVGWDVPLCELRERQSWFADIRPQLLTTFLKASVQIRGDRALNRVSHHGDESGTRQLRTHRAGLVPCNDTNAIALRRWQREEPLSIARVGLAAAEDPALRGG